MNAILKKELRVAFGGLFGYATVALLLLFSGAFFALFNLLSGYPEFSYTLVAMHLVLVFVIPFLTMRSLAEERHDRTDFLLYSLPIRLHEVVLGKFFAMLTLFLIPTAISALYPLLLSFLGKVSLISAYSSLVGYILLGGALIAICMYLSSLVESQILAAILSLAAMLALYFADSFASLIPAGATVSFLICVCIALLVGVLIWRTSKLPLLGTGVATGLVLILAVLYLIKSSLFASLIPNLINTLALFARYGGFVGGYFDLGVAALYLTVTGFFLYLTYRSMEKRRIM